MGTNFEYLKNRPEYILFSEACIEAEKIYNSSPSVCAFCCRKALELAVKWVYSADNTIKMPYRENLQSLIHESSFRNALDTQTWKKLPYIIKLGNMGAHTDKKITKDEVILSLKGLFEFVQWIDYCYSSTYEERIFDEKLIPADLIPVDEDKAKMQEELLLQKNSEIEKLQEKIKELSKQYTFNKETYKNEREFISEDISEYETRQKYIDVDLKSLGWTFGKDIRTEFPVINLADKEGNNGFADYVLFGDNGLPLAVIEAKRTSKDPNIGRQQAVLYAEALEKMYEQKPMIFTTNGFETYFSEKGEYNQIKVSGFFTKDELQKFINRRNEKKILETIKISDKITDRYYQKEAIRAVCENIRLGYRKSLLVMATGTGKTRTAASLVDVLSRGGYITNVLFLADRTALVNQAKEDFGKYLEHTTLCNLVSNKDDRKARIVFSTYQTMMNAIDNEKNEERDKIFTPAHFDLIIIDESHRSIFKKYKAIFEYFYSLMIGLTATPKTDVDRNTYDFFEMENGVPTYVYDYETAVEKDHVLVPYHNIEIKTKFLEEGIHYDDLSAEEKQQYEEQFAEDDTVDDTILPSEINRFIFNKDTVDKVLNDLMTYGIKINGGNQIGKTIIFAQNKNHAEFILQRFNSLFPQYHGNFAKRVVCDDAFAQSVIDEFKQPDKEPYIAISVDMLDTGIDVPECVNLVFFKKVRSKTKFWQMIGRGTRLCKDVEFFDSVNSVSERYIDKKRFFIFDYCGNFEFFRENPNIAEGGTVKSLNENIFCKKISIIKKIQDSCKDNKEYEEFKSELINSVYTQVKNLNTELFSVKLEMEAVQKYNKIEKFNFISEEDKNILSKKIAPLVFMEEKDEKAKMFDNIIYGIILMILENNSVPQRNKKTVCYYMDKLEKASRITAVKNKLSLIKEIKSEEFWKEKDILKFEYIRSEIRELIKLIEIESREIKYIDFEDMVTERKEGEKIDSPYDFEDYKLKVNRYIEENKNNEVIYKLRNNIPLSQEDFKELEMIFTVQLGSKDDYEREFGKTAFGILVRKIAKLEPEAVMKAFSNFINEQSLNSQQIAFVNKVIEYISENGYIENENLTKAPFDRPVKFINLFNIEKCGKFMEILTEINNNACMQ